MEKYSVSIIFQNYYSKTRPPLLKWTSILKKKFWEKFDKMGNRIYDCKNYYIMKLKIQLSEGFHTWILKNSIEIDTDNYPELQGMDENEVLEYIKKNNEQIKYKGGESSEDWTLFDDMFEQDDVYTKIGNSIFDVQFG